MPSGLFQSTPLDLRIVGRTLLHAALVGVAAGLVGAAVFAASEYVPVRAPVSALEGFSGHADADELLAWMRQLPSAPQQTFVVHGEPDAADTLRLRIKDELGWTARVPQLGETVNL